MCVRSFNFSFMSRRFYIQDWYYGDQLLVRNGREIGNNCILHPHLSISEEDFDNLSRYDKKVIKKFFGCDTIKELKKQVKFDC